MLTIVGHQTHFRSQVSVSHADFNKWLIESGGILQQVDQDQIHKDPTIMEW